MRITVKVGLIAATAWIIIRYSMHLAGLYLLSPAPAPAVLLNILGLLTAIVVGLYLHKKKETEESNALLDMKQAMSAGLPYVVVVGGFIYLYYGIINPECYQHQITEKDVEIERMVNDPKQLEAFKKQHEDAEVMTKEQIARKLKQNNNQWMSAGFTSTLAILAMLMLATIYSMLVTIVLRRFLFPRRIN
jgi:hypothetical protein